MTISDENLREYCRQTVTRFLISLRSQIEEDVYAGARELQQYMCTELQTLTHNGAAMFIDEITTRITQHMKSDEQDKKGLILAIIILVSVDDGKTTFMCTRFGNLFRGLIFTDIESMEFAAYAIGRIAISNGLITASYVEFEVTRAFEMLSEDDNELKMHLGVLMLNELANCTPNFFLKHLERFFEVIFSPLVQTQNKAMQESAIKTLRSVLYIVCTKESSEKQIEYFQLCLNEALQVLESSILNNRQSTKDNRRDDKVYGSLLILEELLRCAAKAGEHLRTTIEDITYKQHVFESSRSKYQVTREWGEISITNSLRNFIQSNSRNFGNDGLASLLDYHQSMGFKPNSLPNIRVLPLASNLHCNSLISSNFDRIMNIIRAEMNNQTNTNIKKMVLRIIPRMAQFNQFERSRNFDRYLGHILELCKKKHKERSNALIAFGLISSACNVQAHIPVIMKTLKEYLQAKDILARKKNSIEPAVIICLNLLAQSVPQHIKKKLEELLDLLLTGELSPALNDTLYVISECIPELKKDIQEKLFKIIYQILIRKRYLHSGAPKHIISQFHGQQSQSTSNSATALPSLLQATSPIASGQESLLASQNVILALQMLGRFDFNYKQIIQFLLHNVQDYLSSNQAEIRLECVRTCFKMLRILLLSVKADDLRKRSTLVNLIQEQLQQLLMIGKTDSHSEIRYTVLSLLHTCFDSFLSQTEHLTQLFICLNDEVFEIRELAMCIIGRLSELNPAFVKPRLRNMLTELLNNLENAALQTFREQNTRMLTHIITYSPKFALLYTNVILQFLICRLKQQDQQSTNSILSILFSIGFHARVVGCRLRAYLDTLFSLLLEIVQDSSHSFKREIGLWTLAQVVDNSGCVVDPYWKYKNLLDILLNIFRTEQSIYVRREATKVLGLLGAVDPYQHKINVGLIDQSGADYIVETTSNNENSEQTSSELLASLSASNEQFYLQISITNMLKILRDPTLSANHVQTIEGITFIFTTFSQRTICFVNSVFPTLLMLIKNSEHQVREAVFCQLCTLIPIVKDHIKEYLEQLFFYITEYWQVNAHQVSLIHLVEILSTTLKTEFKQHLLPKLLPEILRSLSNDKSDDKQVTIKILGLIQNFDDNSFAFLNVLLPAVLKLFENQDLPIDVRRRALNTIKNLNMNLNLQDFFSVIWQPAVRVYHSSSELHDTAHDLIINIVQKYEKDQKQIDKLLSQNQIALKSQSASLDRNGSEPRDSNRKTNRSQNRISTTKKPFIFSNTLESSSLHSLVTNVQSSAYIKEVFFGLLNSTPSLALKYCLRIARSYDQLPKDVFNAAFISCWTEMNETNRKNIVRELERILKQENSIPEVVTVILNLVEFMHHTEEDISKGFTIDLGLLSEVALKHRTYAKALRFKENEFYAKSSCKALESLIFINNKLRQKPAVSGILKFATTKYGIDFKVKEQWYEKLHDWENALRAYQQRRETSPNDLQPIIGQMRCLEMLGEWDELYKLSVDTWPKAGEDQKCKIAQMCAASAWSLGKWEDMEVYTENIRRTTFDSSFYQAVLAVHKEQYELAQKLIDEARDKINSHLTAMVNESQDRAYGAMVNVMLFAELEEVIQFKLMSEKQELIKMKWWSRLQGCQKNVEDWQKILRVRSLVLSPAQDKRSWLKFASVCQKVERMKMSQKTLIMLLKDEQALLAGGNAQQLQQQQGCLPSGQLDTPSKNLFTINSSRAARGTALTATCPEITYAYIKQLWRSNEKKIAIEQMKLFLDELDKKRKPRRIMPAQFVTQEEPSVFTSCNITPASLASLHSKGYLKLGSWLESQGGINNNDTMPEILPCYARAAEIDPSRYKAWHAYAYCNFKFMSLLKDNNDAKIKVANEAVRGFFKSISLLNGSSLQDTLRLLTVLFDEGHEKEINENICKGLNTVPIETWLQVIPQLIARVDTTRTLVCKLIQKLLIDVGRHHPQALIYPLTVAQKSTVRARQEAANAILNSMREHSNNLVQQAALVSDELIRVSILWHELWCEGLEEASRLYFGDKNVKGMLEILEPLHSEFDRGPTTQKEASFKNAFQADLIQAQKLCRKYVMTGDVKNVTSAWEFYYHVFKKISKQLPQLTSLELQYVSPKLLACRDLELAVPGNYNPNRSIVRIARIESELTVITSKQRPRKLSIIGSNGRVYMFLLKGHEDLRQDERVMQLFGLVNTLLASDFETSRRNLAIQRYAVIPLSHNSGLIGWVPQCDTMHTLIKDYRDKNKTLLNIEHRIMLRVNPNYDRLTLMQKVEIFELALEHTKGDDIQRLLWNKSPNSEVWLERRTNYIRSLAVMSMVGYILGLGDRHPSNLMIDRLSGKVLHIDFGDCFEVAMTRDKFPEKVPFRLTRMLIKAMEVTGIEGTYRITCEKVMRVLRNNKDSLMAVLEAFIYDPLMTWGLNEANETMEAAVKSPSSDVVDSMINSTAQLDLNEFHQMEAFKINNNMISTPLKPNLPPPEPLNKKAVTVVNRISAKLTGLDFGDSQSLSVPHQVDLLIQQATSNENLCQLYIGWCSFW